MPPSCPILRAIPVCLGEGWIHASDGRTGQQVELPAVQSGVLMLSDDFDLERVWNDETTLIWPSSELTGELGGRIGCDCGGGDCLDIPRHHWPLASAQHPAPELNQARCIGV